MNSSGIKRGLAATAISALAVTGLPALATTANAAVGDNFTVTYTGPALNGGDEGALVIIRAQDNEIDETLLKATSTSSTEAGSEDNGDQNIGTITASAPVNDPADSDYEFIEVRVPVTTTETGDTATFRLFEDDGDDLNTLEASEARQTVSISTAGPLASIDVSPATQSSPENIESGAYTVTIKDAAGRTTQLLSTESLTIEPEDGTVTVSETGTDTDTDDGTITSDEIVRGTDTFTATGTTAGSYDIVVENAADTIDDTAVLNVTEAANLTADEIDIVTAADDWDGYDGGSNGGTTVVRVDQNTIRFDFDAGDSDANSNVKLTVDGTDIGPGNGVTFGGEDEASYTTTLDANGNGSITVTADAATVQDGDTVAVDINGFTQTLEFDRASAASLDGESATYFCQDDAQCTVTAVVLDQFGNPVTTGEVEASRSGHNSDATPQRKPVGSDGTVDFTFTDTTAADGGTDTVLFEYFVDQFENTATLSDSSTTIKYTATGQGSDYVISLDGENTEDADYEADDAAVIPLFDTVADTLAGANDEDAVITIANGEALQAVTLSVDNDALILAPGETMLSEGSASVEATLTAGGALPAGYRVIGTKSGLVTLTVDTAGRTETAPLTVLAQDDVASARNVTLTAPATVPVGTTQISFTAVVTDAFGNPVPGVPNSTFNKQVTGPGMYQDGDVQSDANGQITMNVRVDSGATGDVTLSIDADDTYGQFGAEADRLRSDSVTDDGEDLSASSDEASATSTVEEPVVEKINAALTLKGTDNRGADDSLFANAIKQTKGATVKLFRKRADGTWKFIQRGTLNSLGNHRFDPVNDKNGNKKSRYKAVVHATARTNAGDDFKSVR